MNKQETDKLIQSVKNEAPRMINVDDESDVFVSEKAVINLINSMTTDTDPRLEVVERIRKAIPSMTGLFGDHWCNQEAVRIESLEDELDKIESEIKQEAGDE
ncbi:hypothetical protein [Rhodobacteraceae phage LS06-2018-MD07]|jgi:hypothetical protein|nr:hypothetical protein [Rhodobacteraceae phage LS06-2018-MD07]